MTYTFISAIYSNNSSTAVIANTAEVGSVLITLLDTPSLWSSLIASGVSISPFIQPTVTPPPVVVYSPDGNPWVVTIDNNGDITTQSAV